MDKGLLAVVTILMVIFAGALAYALYVVAQPAGDVLVEEIDMGDSQVDVNTQLVEDLQRQIQAEIQANEDAIKLYQQQVKDLENRLKAEQAETQKLLEEQTTTTTTVSSSTSTKPRAKFYTAEYLQDYDLKYCSADQDKVESFLDDDYNDYEDDFQSEVKDAEARTKLVRDKVAELLAMINTTASPNVLNVNITETAFRTEFDKIDDLLDDVEDALDDVANEMDQEELRYLSSWNSIHDLIKTDADTKLGKAKDNYDDADNDLDDPDWNGVRNELSDVVDDIKDVEDKLNDADKDFDELERDAKNFRSNLNALCN